MVVASGRKFDHLDHASIALLSINDAVVAWHRSNFGDPFSEDDDFSVRHRFDVRRYRNGSPSKPRKVTPPFVQDFFGDARIVEFCADAQGRLIAAFLEKGNVKAREFKATLRPDGRPVTFGETRRGRIVNVLPLNDSRFIVFWRKQVNAQAPEELHAQRLRVTP